MTEPKPTAATPPPRRKGVARGLRVLAAALVIAVGLMLTSARGLIWLTQTFVPTLTFSALEGSLLEGATLRDAHWTTPKVTTHARRLALHWHASLHGGLELRDVEAE